MYICVYCYDETDEHYCRSCGEYDGIMPQEEAEDYLNVRTPGKIAAFNKFVDEATKQSEELADEEIDA